MWADDKYWYPLMFENKNFYANFVFKGYDEILSYSVEEVVSEEELIELHQKIVNYPLYNI
jgi:hypothetical protein